MASARQFPHKVVKVEGKTVTNWLQMFAAGWLSPLSDNEKAQVIEEVEAKLRSNLYYDGGWTADYRRIRLLAYKH